MTDDRKSSVALTAGMLGSIITMALHPTAHDLTVHGRAEAMSQLNIAVHSLALVCIPILFLGAIGLTKRLNAPNRLALSGLVLFGFGEVAIMIAAVASGLIAPGLIHHMLAAEPGTAGVWSAVLALDGHINQAFAMVFVVASSAAIVLWSVAILKNKTFARILGVYGCIFGPLTILAVVSGHLHLNVHGFGLVVLLQAIWFITAAVQLWKINAASPGSLAA